MNNGSGSNTCRRSARSRNVSESSESSCFGSDTRSIVSSSTAITRRLRCPTDSEANSPLDNTSPSRVKRKKRRKNEDEISEARKKIIKRHLAQLSRRKPLDEELIRLKLKDDRIPIVLLSRLEDEPRSQPQPKHTVEVEEEKEKEKEVDRVKLPGLSIPAKVDLKILKHGPIIKINKQQTENLLQVRKKRLLREKKSAEVSSENGLVEDSDGSGVTSESDKCAEKLTEKLENYLSNDNKCTKNTIVSSSDKRLARISISKDINDRLPERLLKSDSRLAERSDSESQPQSSKSFIHSNKRLTRNSIDQNSDKHSAVLVNSKPKDTESTLSSGKDSDDSSKNVKKYSKHTSNDNVKHSQVIDKCSKKNLEVSVDCIEKSVQSLVKEISENQSEVLSKIVSENLESNSRLRKRLTSKSNEKRPDDSAKSSSCESTELCTIKQSEKCNNTIQVALESFVEKPNEKIDSKPSRRLESKIECSKNETEVQKRTVKKLVDKNESYDNDDSVQNCANFVENIVEKCETLSKLSKNVEKRVNNQTDRRRSTRNFSDKIDKLTAENNPNCTKSDAKESSKSQSQSVDKNIQKCSTNENSKRLTRNHIVSVENTSENEFKKFDDKVKSICKSIMLPVEEKSEKLFKRPEEKVTKTSDKSIKESVKDTSENLSKDCDDKIQKIPKISVENDKRLKKNLVNKKQKHVDNLVVSNVDSKQNFVKESKKPADVHDESKKIDIDVVEINQRLTRKSSKNNDAPLDTLTKTVLRSEEIPIEINEQLFQNLNTDSNSTQTDVSKRKPKKN